MVKLLGTSKDGKERVGALSIMTIRYGVTFVAAIVVAASAPAGAQTPPVSIPAKDFGPVWTGFYVGAAFGAGGAVNRLDNSGGGLSTMTTTATVGTSNVRLGATPNGFIMGAGTPVGPTGGERPQAKAGTGAIQTRKTRPVASRVRRGAPLCAGPPLHRRRGRRPGG